MSLNIVECQCNFVNNALIALIFVPLYLDSRVTVKIIQNIFKILSVFCHKNEFKLHILYWVPLARFSVSSSNL
jgi:type IV secretory pathway VirB3-like protein